MNIQHGIGTNTSKETQTFVKYPDNIEEDSVGEIIQIHSGNSNASVELTYNYRISNTLTPEQAAAIGTLAAGNYWLASPCVACFPNLARFDVYYMFGGRLYSDYLLNSNGSADDYSHGVRAVVSI